MLPDVPTIAESGLAGFRDSTFNGIVAPAGTPREIVERLHGEIVKAVAAPDLRDRFLQQGIELIASSSPEAFATFLRQQGEEFARLARETGMSIQ